MKLLQILCLCVVSNLGTDVALADGGCAKPICCDRQPCQTSCRLLTCRPEVKTIKVSKTRFEVGCDRFCIPAITFPWNKRSTCDGDCVGGCQSECLVPKCGRVITVRVLKKQKYHVEKCVCDWIIEEVACEACCKPDCCDVAAPSAPLIKPADPGTAPAPPVSTQRPPLFSTH